MRGPPGLSEGYISGSTWLALTEFGLHVRKHRADQRLNFILSGWEVVLQLSQASDADLNQLTVAIRIKGLHL